VYKDLLGGENVTSESLAALTKGDYHGDYARARLDGKLVNIASDISAKISDEGMAKTLISREMVSARHPNQRGFDMRNYARLVFAMNDLPPQIFSDAALTKRAAIIEFGVQISPEDKDTNFAEKIMANELPGILNWIIAGLDRLLKTGRLDPPQCCVEDMERMRKEFDPLSAWLESKGRVPGDAHWTTLKTAYEGFTDFCKENGNQVPSKKTFAQRLRGLGYKIDCVNHSVGTVLHFSKSVPDNHSDTSVIPENRDEEDYFVDDSDEVPF
jgi:putative DNA primase/helicase